MHGPHRNALRSAGAAQPWNSAGKPTGLAVGQVGQASGGGPDSGARLARVEAALWLAEAPLSLKRLSQAASLTGVAEARKLVAELGGRLAERGSALEVIEVAGGFRMTTRPCFAPWLDALVGDQRSAEDPPRLTPAGEETLTVVAFRQPVVRAEIEAIRGVGCGDVLRQLMEADLLRIVGRSKELGRPLLYGTTERFLELYGLGSLDDLPGRNEGADGAGPTKHNAAHGHAA